MLYYPLSATTTTVKAAPTTARTSAQFTLEVWNANIGTMKAELTISFKKQFGSNFLSLEVTTTKPSSSRRRLAKIKFYVTVLLAGKVSDLSSEVTTFILNELPDSLKTQGLCSDSKPCTASKPVVAAGTTTTPGGVT